MGSFSDDHGESADTATAIPLGSISGVIESRFDEDLFRFFAEGGANYIAEVLLESHPNTILVLLDSSGNVVGENDDGEGLNGGSRLMWAAHPTSEEYFLLVRSFDPNVDTGSYTLSVSSISDDHGDSFEDATFISPGSISGTLDPPHDIDVFGFSARSGESYIIEVVLDGHPDTVLSLYQWPGVQLDEVDDTEGMSGGSRISGTVTEEGDYFIKVRSYDPDFQSGGYVIYLDVTAAPQIVLSGFYSGTITSFEDGTTAQLELKLDESRGEVFGYLTLYDPHIGSGEIESFIRAGEFLRFSVPTVYRGVTINCDYVAENLENTAGIAGYYECFLGDGTFQDTGEWSAFRQ